VDRSRLEAFSDGVFRGGDHAARPQSHGGPTWPRYVAHQLGTHWPAFVAYLISFFMIGIVWVNHHVLVRGIAVVDRTLLFLTWCCCCS